VEPDALSAIVEAILLTARGPVTATMIAEAVGEPEVAPSVVEDTLRTLQQEAGSPRRGVRLEHVAGGWRYVTSPQLDPYLQTFHGIVRRQRLSQAALEVLSVVAHRQPVTLPEVNFIRGAISAGVVRTLLDRKLIRLAGRKQVVGKPFLYRTTQEFLVHFGLERVEDLPDPEQLVGESGGVSAGREV
jgi:segregation and condensation protein B